MEMLKSMCIIITISWCDDFQQGFTSRKNDDDITITAILLITAWWT